MKLRDILLIVLALLLIVALWATIFNPTTSVVNIEPKEDASIAVTGDVMFARKMPNVLSMDSSPFSGVSDVTSNVDLLLINFENAATSSGDALKGDVPLKCDPSYVPLAKANNVTVAGLANNHAIDYGITGMQAAVFAEHISDFAFPGSDISGRYVRVRTDMPEQALHKCLAEAHHFRYSAYDSEDAQKQIAANNDSDLIVAYLHFGNEYSNSPNENQVKIAHELIDYGADVVVGSHPHVTQGIEMYNGKPIFYSLGNFIFDQSNTATHSAYFVQIDLVNNTGECTVYPIYISNYLPQHMSPDDGTSLLSGLSPQCSELEITSNGTGKLRFNLTDS